MSEPKDVREMRQLIQAASRGHRLDGTVPIRAVSMTSPLIRAVLTMAERDGWSGEDAMTALAYYALRDLEKSFDRELHLANITPFSGFVRSTSSPSGSAADDAGKPVLPMEARPRVELG